MVGINKILGIAIEEYDDKSIIKLDNCRKDIGDIINQLTERYSFDEIEFIYKKEETKRKNIALKIREFFRNAIEGDSLLLLFAGHGEFDDEANSTYWQPSDADSTDPSSWIILSEVLNSIRISKATHISIISDSCFSGGIFQRPTRGGGIEKLKGLKSREALTSGGVEKVSDGAKNGNSPFAETLLKILKENIQKELLFHNLSYKLIANFEEKERQTPRYGIIEGMNADGGSFLFKLKDSPSPVETKSTIKPLLGKLFLPLLKQNEEDIEKLKSIVEKKYKLVKAQRYEEAALWRDKEKKILKQIGLDFQAHLNSFSREIKLEKKEIEQSASLNEEIKEHNRELEEEEKNYLKIAEESSKGEPEIKKRATEVSLFFSEERDRPAIEYFNKNVKEMYGSYKKGIMELYQFFKRIKGEINCEFLNKKDQYLNDLLTAVYPFQIQILTSPVLSEIKKEIDLKELESKILKWIEK